MLDKKKKQRYIMLMTLLVLLLTCVFLHFSSTMKNKPTLTANNSKLHDLRPKIFTPDWGVAATLVSLNHPPYAVGDKKGYSFRVAHPKLTDDIKDVGYRGQPNPEMLAELDLDIIIDTPNFKSNRRIYPQHIPTVLTDFHNRTLALDEVPKWSMYADNIQHITHAIQQDDIAKTYIKQSHEQIIAAGQSIRHHIGDHRKFLVTDFWDMRQMSVFNNNSIISLTTQMMGLDLISIGKPTPWGSSYIYPDKLYELPKDTCLIIIDPILEFTKQDNLNSSIWLESQFAQENSCVYRIEPVWTNNGMEAMVTFAKNLEQAVNQSVSKESSYGLMNKNITATKQ